MTAVRRFEIGHEGGLEAPVGLEPTMVDLQSTALPLGYGAGIRAGSPGVKGREAPVGVEPTMMVLQTIALPLGYGAEQEILTGHLPPGQARSTLPITLGNTQPDLTLTAGTYPIRRLSHRFG